MNEKKNKTMEYESVIGLEVHVQIKTESKLFCQCSTLFGTPANTNICPVCCGYPGVLPVLNKKAVEYLIKTALALDCAVNLESIFARKQYFYPDLPKNYQISQYEKPLAENGLLALENKKVRVKRIHLEEDAGKLLHTIGAQELDYSLVDLNRTGIALMEIVSEPDISSPEEAERYLLTLKRILEYLEVSDCDMEKGSLRCDANVSIRPKNSATLGTRVELKNMNSFSGIKDALQYEIRRQTEAVEEGKRVVQETRLWDTEKKESRSMRSKEEAHDYRYFPEPDLLPLRIEEKQIEEIRKSLPELPDKKKNRFMRDYQLSEYDAQVLTMNSPLARYYEKSLKAVEERISNEMSAKMVANWITSELMGRLNSENKTIQESPISAEKIAELVRLILDETISGKIAKTVFDEMWNSNKSAKEIVEAKGLAQVLDETQIEKWVLESIEKNPKAAEEYKSGKEKAIGALVGAVMKLSKGQANPERVNQILKDKLSGTNKS